MTLKQLIATIVLLCMLNYGHAQQNKVDSIQLLIDKTVDKNQKGGLLIFRSKANTPINFIKAREDAQEALSYYQQTGNVEGQVDAYLQFSGLYSREAKYELALDFDSISYNLAKQKNYKKGMAVSLSNMGRNLQQVGTMELAKKSLLEADEMHKEAGLEAERAEIKNRIGILYRRVGDFKNSIKYFDDALQIATLYKSNNALANIYMNKANTLDETAMYDEAIKNHLLSIRIKEKNKDVRGLAQSYNNIANVYNHIGQYQEALNYYKLTRVIHENIKPVNKTSIALAYNNLGQGYIAVQQLDSVEYFFKKSIALFLETKEQPGLALSYHNLGGFYLQQKAYTNALQFLNLALEIRKESLLKNDEASTRNLLGVVFGKLNKPAEAEKNLLQALALVNNKNGRLQEEIYQSLATHYNQIGNFEKATEYQAKYFSLKDTLLSESETINILKEKANYDVEKKEIALQIAQKEKQIASLTISQQSKTITFFAVVVGLLLLLAVLLFYFFKQKQKAEKLLKIKNDKIETLVKELHHRVKNNLQIVSGLLALQSNRLEDESAKKAMDAGRNRVDAMALIHQKLYMDENLASVNIENYVNQLANSLATSFGFDNSVVKTNINLNPKELDIDIAIPIGLIINELLTNSFKYAFTQIEEALVTITLKKDDNGKIDLNITDNGKGFNENNKKQENFGLKLVSTLVEQLNGNLTLANKNGTTYQIILNPTI